MLTLKSTFSFEAAHRLYDVDTYSAECRENLHGHSYQLTVYLSRQLPNDAGMVMDFKLFKKIVNDVIVDKYDHSCILRDSDPIAIIIQQNCKKVHTVSDSPTAEWMAQEYFRILSTEFYRYDKELKLLKVSVMETENNIATYSPEGYV